MWSGNIARKLQKSMGLVVEVGGRRVMFQIKGATIFFLLTHDANNMV